MHNAFRAHNAIRLMVMLLLAWALGACAVLDLIDRSPTTARLATEYATLKVIDGDPERAERVHAIATDVREALTGQVASSVDQLHDYVYDQIRWDRLDSADTALVRSLMDELRLELERRLGDGLLAQEDRLRVDRVVGWVQMATGVE